MGLVAAVAKCFAGGVVFIEKQVLHILKQSAMNYLDQVQLPKANYAELVKAFAESFVKKARNQFTSEDVRAAYDLAGHPQPAEPRVWGAAFKQLSTTGLIIPIGWSIYKGKQGHGKPCRVWRSAVQFEQYDAKEIIGRQVAMF
jgi:hypothetical protein